MPENGTIIQVDDQGVDVIDVSGLNIPKGEMMSAMREQHPEMAAMMNWASTIQKTSSRSGGRGRAGGILARDRYLTPTDVLDQIDLAREAAESDDIVSGVLESTEALAFKRMSFLCEDSSEQDIWNQIAADLDLDSRFRELWRELNIASQVYCAVIFGKKTYKVRGTTEGGNQKRKAMTLEVPLGLTLLDPHKIIPVGGLLFNQERLVYRADSSEVDMLDAAIRREPGSDEFARQIMVEKYQPDELERKALADENISYTALYLLDSNKVFRHTLTRPQFQRFASVRMKSVFELLDMKSQLRQMDRVFLLGARNFICLITKGTDQHPGKPAEIAQLNAQVQTMGSIPFIVGDHRLDIKIVTTPFKDALDESKYAVLNQAIQARLYQTFLPSGVGQQDDSLKLAKVIARGMESRRHMLKRTVERKILQETVRRNPLLTDPDPKIRFYPARIELSFDSALVNFLIDMRDRGDISRDTYLNEMDFSQADEAILRKREAKEYDKIFAPTIVPWSGNPNQNPDSPLPTDPRTGGRNGGGNRNGGGGTSGNGAGKAPKRGIPTQKETP